MLLCARCREALGARLVAPECTIEDVATARVLSLVAPSPVDAARAWLGTAAPSASDTELRRMVRGLLMDHDVMAHALRAHAELFLDALDLAMESRDAAVENAAVTLAALKTARGYALSRFEDIRGIAESTGYTEDEERAALADAALAGIDKAIAKAEGGE